MRFVVGESYTVAFVLVELVIVTHLCWRVIYNYTFIQEFTVERNFSTLLMKLQVVEVCAAYFCYPTVYQNTHALHETIY